MGVNGKGSEYFSRGVGVAGNMSAYIIIVVTGKSGEYFSRGIGVVGDHLTRG